MQCSPSSTFWVLAYRDGEKKSVHLWFDVTRDCNEQYSWNFHRWRVYHIKILCLNIFVITRHIHEDEQFFRKKWSPKTVVSYILELNLWKHRSQSSVEFFQWFWARWNAENMNFPKIYVLNFFGTFHNTYSQCAHRHNSTTRIWVNILDVFSNFLQIHQYFVRLPFSAMIASITFVWLAITSATAFLGIVFAVFNSRLCSVFWLRRDRITPAYFLKSFSFKRLWTLSHGIVSWLLGGYPPWTLWFFPADGYGLIPVSSNTLYGYLSKIAENRMESPKIIGNRR